MLSRFSKFFKPPKFEDPDRTRRAQNLHTILSALLVAVLCWVWYPFFVQGGVQIAVAIVVLLLLLGLYFLLKRGYVTLVGSLLTSLLWLVVIGSMAAFGGIRNSGFAAIAIVIVIASLTLGARAGFLYALVTIAAGVILVLAENRGMLPVYAFEPNTTILISYSLTVLGIGLLLFLTIGNINKAFQASQAAEKNAKDAISSLKQSHQELEQRSLSLEQRNMTLQTVAEMAQLATQSKTESDLLQRTVRLLVDKLNADHVGIFLMDEPEENVVLCAVNGLDGEKLFANKYALKVTSSALVFASPEAEAIKHQSGGRVQYVSRPASLPESKTNISIPIATGDKLVGLINIQSNAPDPWPAERETLQIIANQIALSLDNIHLLERLQKQLQDISHLAGETTQTAWKRWASGESLGFQYDQLHVLPTSETFSGEVYESLSRQKSASYITAGEDPCARLVAPIILRDSVIGVIGYEDANPVHDWLQTEKVMLETIASRVSLALENSRLVAEAEQRAEREQTIGRITTRVRETLDFDTILQTAIQEMHSSFELQEAEIRLQTSAPEPKAP